MWQTYLHCAGVKEIAGSYGRATIDWMTRIHTGIDESGTNAMVSNAGQLTGAALGFNKAEPTRLKAETFTIKVSC